MEPWERRDSEPFMDDSVAKACHSTDITFTQGVKEKFEIFIDNS